MQACRYSQPAGKENTHKLRPPTEPASAPPHRLPTNSRGEGRRGRDPVRVVWCFFVAVCFSLLLCATLCCMSVTVRVSDGVEARVRVLAGLERRSFANMVEVLLLAALEGVPEDPVRPDFAVGRVGPAREAKLVERVVPVVVPEPASVEATRVLAGQQAQRGWKPDPKPEGKGKKAPGKTGGGMCAHRVPAGAYCKQCEEAA